MKTAVIIVLALLVIVLGGGFLVSTFLWITQLRKNAELENDSERVRIVVAAVDLPAGTAISDPETLLTHKSYPIDLAPVNYISNSIDLVGMKVNRDVKRGEPITLLMLQRREVER